MHEYALYMYLKKLRHSSSTDQQKKEKKLLVAYVETGTNS